MKASKKELFYNEFSDIWEGKINNLETQKRLKVVFGNLLKGQDLKGKKFLEVGCGLGYFSEKACKLGAKVVGVDVGEKLVGKCQKRISEAKFVVASASSLPFRDGSFDILLCTEVIEHVENQEMAIKEMLRVLKKGGCLVITSPNKFFWPIFTLLSILKIRPYQGNEKWFYPWELKRQLLNKNTTIAKEIYFNFFYPKKPFDYFERCSLFKYLMINQGYLIIKH